MDEEPSKEVMNELFSEQERKNIVRSFLDAHIRGKCTIDFPEVGEEKLTGGKVTGEELHQIKRVFSNNFLVLVGTVKSTKAEFNQALYDMFDLIIAAREQNRIKGDFLAINDVDRLRLLEARVSDIEGLFQELQMRLRVGDKKPP